MNSDLFPETLIVRVQHGQPMTSSLLVAQYFGKRHDNVMRDIKALVARTTDPALLLNFEEQSDTYCLKGKLRQRPIYALTRDGFFFTVMGFTGAEADAWKWRFLQAFKHMEAELHRLHTAKAHALDMLRSNLQAVIDGERVGANRALVARYMGKTVGSVTYHRCVARRLGLIGQQRQGAQA